MCPKIIQFDLHSTLFSRVISFISRVLSSHFHYCVMIYSVNHSFIFSVHCCVLFHYCREEQEKVKSSIQPFYYELLPASPAPFPISPPSPALKDTMYSLRPKAIDFDAVSYYVKMICTGVKEAPKMWITFIIIFLDVGQSRA